MFDDRSRYARLPTATWTGADGRVVTHVTRRFLPPGEDLALATTWTVNDAERLDWIAWRTLGSPEAWWWIADANDAMDPEDLLEIGAQLRVPVPRPG